MNKIHVICSFFATLLISTVALANEGSASSDGSNRAEACDKATKKAIDSAQSDIRFEKSTKASRAQTEAEVQTTECTCSNNEGPTVMYFNKATCQVKWSVKWH